jgi:hypothetical protein
VYKYKEIEVIMFFYICSCVRKYTIANYLTPKEVFEGKTEERLAERREKLHTTYINRRAFRENHEACSTL